MRNRLICFVALIALAVVTGCTDVEHDHHHHDHEVMTSVVLTFASQSTDEVVEATWADIEDDGNPVIDSIALTDGQVYDLSITIWNDLENPPEEVTPEIRAEAAEHQVFIFGSAVAGPAGEADGAFVTHAYVDADEDGNWLGLENTISADEIGSGVMSVLLRHMPYQDGNSVKTSTLAEDFAEGGSGALPGDSDFSIDFDIEVL